MRSGGQASQEHAITEIVDDASRTSEHDSLSSSSAFVEWTVERAAALKVVVIAPRPGVEFTFVAFQSKRR